MILKLIIIGSLLVSSALASAVKGYDSGAKGGSRSFAPERQLEIKGAPERRLEPAPASKTSERHWDQQAPIKGTERAEQQIEEIQQQQQQLPSYEQQREELTQQKEEHYSSKGERHYEAKAQVRAEEAKGGARTEQQQQQREELPAATKSTKSAIHDDSAKLEQQRLEQLRFEQQQQQRVDQLQQQREEQQSVELNRDLYEQRRFSDEHYVQQREEVKGATKGQAPIGQIAEAEPYAFDYSVEGSSRRESGDTRGVVRGQYTLQGADGSSRLVDYVADHNGFRATVQTNEFGTESRSPAGVEIRSSQPAAEDISLRLEGKTRDFLEAPAAVKGAPLEPPKRPDNWSIKQAPINLASPVPAPLPAVVAAPVAPAVAAAPLVELDAPRAIKGKTIEEIRTLPSKGDARAEQHKLDSEQQSELLLPHESKGELRAPKALPAAGESKRAAQLDELGQLRSPGFESATSHRVIQHSPAHVVHQQRGQYTHQPATRTVVRQPAPILPVAPVHHRQVPPVRSQYQYDRQAQPVGLLHQLRRGHHVEPSPRLSFYGTGAGESADDSAASFEHPLGE